MRIRTDVFHSHKNESTTETYVSKICEIVKHAGTQDQKLEASRASTQPTCVQSWACPNYLLEFAVSGYLAKAFVINVLPGRDLGGKAESCSTKSSVLRNRLTFESWDFASGPTLIPPGEPKDVWSTRSSMICHYGRSKSPGTTHGSFSCNDDSGVRQRRLGRDHIRTGTGTRMSSFYSIGGYHT